MFSHIINGPVGSGHLGIFGTEDIPESKDEKDLLSLIEQKQILLNHLKFYESEFCSVLNKYHLKFLQWMIKEYEIGTILVLVYPRQLRLVKPVRLFPDSFTN